MPRKKKTPQPYSLTLNMGKKEYKATGDTVEECLDKIKPTEYNAVGIFVLQNDGKVSQSRLVAMRVRRIFGNMIDRQLFAKRLRILL